MAKLGAKYWIKPQKIAKAAKFRQIRSCRFDNDILIKGLKNNCQIWIKVRVVRHTLHDSIIDS